MSKHFNNKIILILSITKLKTRITYYTIEVRQAMYFLQQKIRKRKKNLQTKVTVCKLFIMIAWRNEMW